MCRRLDESVLGQIHRVLRDSNIPQGNIISWLHIFLHDQGERLPISALAPFNRRNFIIDWHNVPGYRSITLTQGNCSGLDCQNWNAVQQRGV